VAASFEFRPAVREDCEHIARLYRISSDGVADYIWTRLAEEGEDILAVGQRRYEREDTAFSYQNCHVAESDGAVVGMLSAFPLYADPDEHESDPVLAPYSELEEDASFYVCGVAMYPQYRGMGGGSHFMALAEQLAEKRGLTKFSLIVFEQNSGALRLYERLGYSEVARRPVYPHPLIHFTGDAILMVKHIGNLEN
jgi:ribosomal protein S18 acetylase RimI-like enzyme